MLGGGALRRRAQRGAAAVEAAILSAFLLIPLLFGVVYWGDYFWKAQRVGNFDVTGIPPGSISGTYTCSDLTNRVKSLLAGNIATLAEDFDIDPDLIETTVTVVRVLPDIGADVEVSVRIPVVSEVASVLPLPRNGVLVQDATQRLENVKVTTASC